MIIEILILSIVLLLSSFFSSSEIALISINKSKIKQLVMQKRKGSETLRKLRERPHKLLINIAIANNIVNIFGASFATAIAIDLFGSKGVGIATGVMTFLILTFGEIIPKTLAVKHTEKVALIAAKPLYILEIIFNPIIKLFELIAKSFTGKGKGDEITEGEIKTMVSLGQEEGAINKIEEEMIHKIFKFDDIHAWEVMTPRTEIIALNIDSTQKDILDTVKGSGFSRIPIFKEDIDKIVGILYVKDLIKYIKGKRKISLKNVMRPALFVPKHKKIDTLLKEFQNKKIHIAMVVEEHGGIEGLVTLEDLLEEIVGEIFDETDSEEKLIKKVGKNKYLIKGSTELDIINKKLKLSLEEREDSNTIGGLILDHLERIPKKNDKTEIDNIKIKIKKVDRQRIEEIELKK